VAELTPDELGQIRRFIAMARDILERYARTFEELEGIRLSLEESRELLADHFEENARWADNLSGRIDRLERYIILVRMTGGNQQTVEIESKTSREHIDRALRMELVTQQELILQYQKNIDKVKLRIAKFGETVPLLNELDDYQKQIGKADEVIARIRESLG
jgi:uncharacterized membrane-anchored protein YhcB (DUF1043 family)